MPHLRLEVPAEWLGEEFRAATGFDAGRLLQELVRVAAGLRLESGAPMVNLGNLKHAIVPVHCAGVGGDFSKRFLHVTLAMGNDTPGRTAELRCHAAEALGSLVDEFTTGLPGLASVTVHVQDLDRSRGYSTTGERRKKAPSGGVSQ
jgi:hypothetical protein